MCKHKSHDKYPIKKHVLVCRKHRNDTEYQEILQKYKDRFIMKQPNQLPSFSRGLKLSFHMNQNQSPNFQKFQTKSSMNIHSFMMLVVVIWFHDMQQSDQLEKEDLKVLWTCNIRRSLGNAQITSSHGTYQLKIHYSMVVMLYLVV